MSKIVTKVNLKILLSMLIIVLTMISFGTISTHAASLPSKGHVYTGTATAEKVHTDYSNTGKSTCVFRNHGDNAFATHVRTYKAKCKSPGVWDPKKGEKYNYRATVTSVDTTSGLVKGTITYTPGRASERVSSNYGNFGKVEIQDSSKCKNYHEKSLCKYSYDKGE